MARCWIAAAEGDLTTAVDLNAGVVARARAGGNLREEALALLDQALFGQPDAPRARQLADATGAPLLTAVADANEAIDRGDADRLVAAAETFAAMDSPMVAAALAGRATGAYTERGARQDAARAIELRQRSEAMCEVAGPLLTDDAATRSVALSPREREVARLAATGLSNRDIAAQLCVSLRTVENHLHRAFSKLGVRRRGDLGAVFGS